MKQIVCLAILLIGSTAALSQQAQPTAFMPVNTQAQNSQNSPLVCTAEDRLRRCFAYNPTNGCLCTVSGDCRQDEADPCSVCADPKVYSFAAGEECPQVQTQSQAILCPKTPTFNQCLVFNPVDGCLCTAPDVCKQEKADTCSVCNDGDVLSFTPGEQCEQVQQEDQEEDKDVVEDIEEPSSKVVCSADNRNVQCLWYNPVEGCLCKTSGVCKTEKADSCSVCNDLNVASFAPGQKCEEQKQPEKQPESETFFLPERCGPKTNPAATSCIRGTSEGCACYADGHCEYLTQTNTCNACLDRDVLSFNENVQCPKIKSDAKLFVCDNTFSDEPVFCTQIIYDGCVCYEDGKCQEGQVNACSDCQRNNVLSVVERGSCPVTKTTKKKQDPHHPIPCFQSIFRPRRIIKRLMSRHFSRYFRIRGQF